MKLRRVLWWIVVLVVLAAGVLLFTDLAGDSLLPGLPKLRFISTRSFATSSITLEQVRDLATFAGVEYVKRTVFPYDFLGEDIDIREIERKIRRGTGDPEKDLSPTELLHRQAWYLADEVGLKRDSSFDFVVITVVHAAGFDLEGQREGFAVTTIPGVSPEDPGSIVVALPQPRIVSVSIEDIESEGYPYPDVPVAAGALGDIARFVQDRPLDELVRQELVEAARTSSRTFLEGLLFQAGFSDVTIDFRDLP